MVRTTKESKGTNSGQGREPTARAYAKQPRHEDKEQHHVPYDAISTLPDGLDKGVPHRALEARAKNIERAGDEGLRHAPPRAPRNTRQRCGRHTRPQVRFEAAAPATAHARATSARAEKDRRTYASAMARHNTGGVPGVELKVTWRRGSCTDGADTRTHRRRGEREARRAPEPHASDGQSAQSHTRGALQRGVRDHRHRHPPTATATATATATVTATAIVHAHGTDSAHRRPEARGESIEPPVRPGRAVHAGGVPHSIVAARHARRG